jgi:hypothetical protein
MELRRDAKGNVITQPLTGYGLTLAAGTVVLLAVDYVNDPRELEAGAQQHRVQLLLTPPQALELSGALRDHANRALQAPPGTKFQ